MFYYHNKLLIAWVKYIPRVISYDQLSNGATNNDYCIIIITEMLNLSQTKLKTKKSIWKVGSTYKQMVKKSIRWCFNLYTISIVGIIYLKHSKGFRSNSEFDSSSKIINIASILVNFQ